VRQMLFCIEGMFKADNIEDAFAKLAQHFVNLRDEMADGVEREEVFDAPFEIEIEPLMEVPK
jgi:hypothetical protein